MVTKTTHKPVSKKTPVKKIGIMSSKREEYDPETSNIISIMDDIYRESTIFRGIQYKLYNIYTEYNKDAANLESMQIRESGFLSHVTKSELDPDREHRWLSPSEDRNKAEYIYIVWVAFPKHQRRDARWMDRY